MSRLQPMHTQLLDVGRMLACTARTVPHLASPMRRLFSRDHDQLTMHAIDHTSSCAHLDHLRAHPLQLCLGALVGLLVLYVCRWQVAGSSDGEGGMRGCRGRWHST